jgi:hypothetical protein
MNLEYADSGSIAGRIAAGVCTQMRSLWFLRHPDAIWNPIVFYSGIGSRNLPVSELGFPHSVFAAELHCEITLLESNVVSELAKVSH